MKHGKNYGIIADGVKTKTRLQVAKHANDLFHKAREDPQMPHAEFIMKCFKPHKSAQAKKLLVQSQREAFIKAVKEHGTDWSVIADKIGNESPETIKQYAQTFIK